MHTRKHAGLINIWELVGVEAEGGADGSHGGCGCQVHADGSTRLDVVLRALLCESIPDSTRDAAAHLPELFLFLRPGSTLKCCHPCCASPFAPESLRVTSREYLVRTAARGQAA